MTAPAEPVVIRVLIADDQMLLRAGLRMLLDAEDDIEVVGEADDGTAAIELALRGLGVGPGDEVILAAYDFEANFKNVLALGATPVLIDVRPDDAQIDLDRLEAAASDKVRAVLVSHLHGGVVDINHARPHAIATIPGITEDVAREIAKVRDELNGFSSAAELCTTLEIPPHVADDVARHAIFLPRD